MKQEASMLELAEARRRPYTGDWWNRRTSEEIVQEAINKLKRDFAALRANANKEQ